MDINKAALKQAKTERRTAKSAFTRVGKALVHAVEHKRAPNDVREAVVKLQGECENLVAKHKEYAKLVEDDEAYETEEMWLSECQEIFMRLEVDAKMLIEIVQQPGSSDLAENCDLSKGQESAVCIEMLENERTSTMHSATPSASDDSHSSGMASMQ